MFNILFNTLNFLYICSMRVIEKVLELLSSELDELNEKREIVLEQLLVLEKRIKEINKEASECYKIRPDLYKSITIGVKPRGMKKKKFNWAGMIDGVLTKYPDLIFNTGELEAMFIREGYIRDRLERNQTITLHVILNNMARNGKLKRTNKHGRWCYQKNIKKA